MNKRDNWQEFQQILQANNITKLYHFTDRDNIESIINNGGLYSWGDCEDKGIKIPKPGGSDSSKQLDARDHLEHYVRVSFTPQHPMMFVAMNDGRISNPVILEIDLDIIYWNNTLYSDRNATKNGAQKGGSIEDFKKIHFNAVTARKHFDLDPDEQPFFQAEVLVKNFIPLKYIKNIGNFGFPIPSQQNKIQSKDAYTAQITRHTPTAFIFLVDHSYSMTRTTTYNGEKMTMADAVAMIVNSQLNELVFRCIKTNDVRHYYDIAVIGYGSEAYSAWSGDLEGRDFVSPEELKNNPYKVITTREEKRTRRGPVVKEVEKVQWMESRSDGNSTSMHKAFKKAKSLLEQWMKDYHDKDCYPPTVINITDGKFNNTTKDNMLQLSNELKSMFTNDGNVLLFNIHIAPDEEQTVVFPTSKDEVESGSYGETLYEMSSLLPTRYNQPISQLKGEQSNKRHAAMAVNADMSTLIQLMDIGTPTNISKSK